MAEQTNLDYRDPEWVADRLSIDKNAVYKLLNDGALPGLQIGRKWLISESSLVQYLKSEERKQTEARRVATSSGWTAETGGPFSKFSEAARRMLVLAQQAAIRMNHNYIGQEHFLLAMVEMPDSVASRVLGGLGMTPEAIKDSVERVTGRGQEPVPLGMIGLTPRVKRAIELAAGQAAEMNHSYIGTEHLLLGLIAEGSGVGWGILTAADITLDKARAEITKLLGDASGAEAEAIS